MSSSGYIWYVRGQRLLSLPALSGCKQPLSRLALYSSVMLTVN